MLYILSDTNPSKSETNPYPFILPGVPQSSEYLGHHADTRERATG